MKIVHEKLVRDYIPKIIRNAGKTCKTRYLSDEEYETALFDKLAEECGEVKDASTIDEITKEIADVEEVLEAIMKYYGINQSEVDAIKQVKAEISGKFEKRIFLEYVRDDSLE